MLVKKQVSSSIRSVKNRGIIGVVRVIDHMVWERNADANEADDLDSSFSTITSLPTRLAKCAATYIGKSVIQLQIFLFNGPNFMRKIFHFQSSLVRHRKIAQSIWPYSLTNYHRFSFNVTTIAAIATQRSINRS